MTGTVTITGTERAVEYALEVCKTKAFKLVSAKPTKAVVAFDAGDDVDDAETLRAAAYGAVAKVGGGPEFKFKFDEEE